MRKTMKMMNKHRKPLPNNRFQPTSALTRRRG